MSFIKRILCFANVLHDYRITKVLSNDSVKCQCVVCGKEVAYNHSMQICIPWDESVEAFYKGIAKKANKKSSKEESDYVKMKNNYV